MLNYCFDVIGQITKTETQVERQHLLCLPANYGHTYPHTYNLNAAIIIVYNLNNSSSVIIMSIFTHQNKTSDGNNNGNHTRRYDSTSYHYAILAVIWPSWQREILRAVCLLSTPLTKKHPPPPGVFTKHLTAHQPVAKSIIWQSHIHYWHVNGFVSLHIRCALDFPVYLICGRSDAWKKRHYILNCIFDFLKKLPDDLKNLPFASSLFLS